jgi:hypothetical protein
MPAVRYRKDEDDYFYRSVNRKSFDCKYVRFITLPVWLVSHPKYKP